MAKTLNSTPQNDGFRMPGEFEPHDGCWMLWPERTDNWRLGAKPAQRVFAKIAEFIGTFESVTVGVNASQYKNARAMLSSKVRVVEISNDDAWMRDCGPTFVINDSGEVRGVDWEFNAWGGLVDGLYFPWDKDDQVAQKVLEIERCSRYRTDRFVLEGGSIHTDGEGTLITTEECLLSPGRNPHLTKEQIEEKLRQYLNVEKIIWLEKGIYNDETNGHVDNICCFARPGEVILAWTDDRNDPQYDISLNAYEILEATTDARDRKLKINKLPLPNPVYITREESEGVDRVEGTLPRKEGDRLAASYVNFYIANGGLIVPVFNDPHDDEAIRLLSSIFPNYTIKPVFAREILLGGGNIHCITQQQPKAKRNI
ncbi:MAG: agmatine deiminase [Candidatus Cloacimonadia bacterium]